MRGLWSSLVLCGVLGAASGASASDPLGYTDDTPSVFGYGYRGLLAGAMVGLGTAYVVARRDGIDGSDWKPMVYGGGLGALGGMALGWSLGAIEARDPGKDRALRTLRNALCAGGLGALAGAIVGAPIAVDGGAPEPVVFAGAIGMLSGVGAGVVVGIVQGQLGRTVNAGSGHALTLTPSWSATVDAHRKQVLLLGARGRF